MQGFLGIFVGVYALLNVCRPFQGCTIHEILPSIMVAQTVGFRVQIMRNIPYLRLLLFKPYYDFSPLNRTVFTGLRVYVGFRVWGLGLLVIFAATGRGGGWNDGWSHILSESILNLNTETILDL